MGAEIFALLFKTHDMNEMQELFKSFVNYHFSNKLGFFMDCEVVSLEKYDIKGFENVAIPNSDQKSDFETFYWKEIVECNVAYDILKVYKMTPLEEVVKKDILDSWIYELLQVSMDDLEGSDIYQKICQFLGGFDKWIKEAPGFKLKDGFVAIIKYPF